MHFKCTTSTRALSTYRLWTLARKMTSFRFSEKVLCFRVRVWVRIRARVEVKVRENTL